MLGLPRCSTKKGETEHTPHKNVLCGYKMESKITMTGFHPLLISIRINICAKQMGPSMLISMQLFSMAPANVCRPPVLFVVFFSPEHAHAAKGICPQGVSMCNGMQVNRDV